MKGGVRPADGLSRLPESAEVVEDKYKCIATVRDRPAAMDEELVAAISEDRVA